MSANVVSCQLEGDKVLVMLEGNSFNEVSDTDAKHLAIKTAQLGGAGRTAISSISGPFIVDASGEEVNNADRLREAAIEFTKAAKEKIPVVNFKFRNEYTLQQNHGF